MYVSQRLCVLSHFRTVQHFSSSDACSCIFIIFILWRKSIAWRYQSLFSDCFPQEQDSFHSKRVIGFCFSRQQTREGLQKPQGLRANSCSSALSLCFLPHYTGSCLGMKNPLYTAVFITASQRSETWMVWAWAASSVGVPLLSSIVDTTKWEQSMNL